MVGLYSKGLGFTLGFKDGLKDVEVNFGWVISVENLWTPRLTKFESDRGERAVLISRA